MTIRSPSPSLIALLLACLFPVQGRAQDAPADYEIGAEDLLQISVAGQREMSGEFPVEPDGMLNFPFLGRVKVSGMTPPDVEKKLVRLLSDGYLKRPQAAVWVKEFRSQKVFLTGELPKPGPQGLKGDRTLLTLLSQQGALPPGAGHVLWVVRPPSRPLRDEDPLPGDPPRGAPALDIPIPVEIPGSEIPGAELFRVARRDLEIGSTERNLVLKAGDTIYAPRAAQVYLQGQVSRTGPLRFEEGMTLGKALALAGGVTNRGAAGRIKLIRIVAGKRVELKPQLDETLQPEDTIVIPERFF